MLSRYTRKLRKIVTKCITEGISKRKRKSQKKEGFSPKNIRHIFWRVQAIRAMYYTALLYILLQVWWENEDNKPSVDDADYIADPDEVIHTCTSCKLDSSSVSKNPTPSCPYFLWVNALQASAVWAELSAAQYFHSQATGRKWINTLSALMWTFFFFLIILQSVIREAQCKQVDRLLVWKKGLTKLHRSCYLIAKAGFIYLFLNYTSKGLFQEEN